MANEIHFGIRGMSCASCVARVERALARRPGVLSASVNLAAGKATVLFEGAGTPVEDLLQAVSRAGYEPVRDSVEIRVEGMTCASCVNRVERELSRPPGVLSASVNLATESVRVEFLPGSVSVAELRKRIADAGYRAVATDERPDRERAARDAERRGLLRDLWLAVGFTVPLVLIAMGPMLLPGLAGWMGRLLPETAWHWIEMLLAAPVQLVAGRRFYRLGFGELRHLNPGMNSLVMLGSSAAFFYSVATVIAPGVFPAGTANRYFEAAAVIVTLILVGRHFEARAKGRTSEAIRQLVRLQPETARVIRDDRQLDVAVEEIVPGDSIVARPGERIAVDGTVVRGSSYVDESMISGEPSPAAKGPGDDVVGGTLNRTGSFTYRATRVGADTVLARIIAMVEQAQAAKPPIQRVADRIAAVFVPLVIAVALLTFGGWMWLGPDPRLSHALVAAVSVLVIACPCAMGLATPTAIMVATGKAAELGALFRRGTALELMARVDTVVMDKTGTLTLGRPELTSVEADDGDENEVLALIASAEQRSEHPVAEAIVTEAQRRGLTLADAEEFDAQPGLGIRATVGGHRVVVGSERFLRQSEIETSGAREAAERLAGEGATPVHAAIDGRHVALLGVADPLKDGSRAAVDALRAARIDVALVTGDDERTARAVAGRLGIDRVVAEVMPDRKADEVKRLQEQGRRVVFVGDGINDAPALAQADVGVAIGTGTDIAIESGDVILMSGDPRGVVNAAALSRRTLRTIKINFFWAYAYNVALIPLAAGVLYPVVGMMLNPMLAAAAMSVSSLFVVSNSLRLRGFSPPLPLPLGVRESSSTSAD